MVRTKTTPRKPRKQGTVATFRQSRMDTSEDPTSENPDTQDSEDPENQSQHSTQLKLGTQK